MSRAKMGSVLEYLNMYSILCKERRRDVSDALEYVNINRALK